MCVCCCSTLRLQTSCSTYLSVCTSKKSLMDAVSNQRVKCSRFCRVDFYWQTGICKVKKLVHAWTILLPLMDFSLFPV